MGRYAEGFAVGVSQRYQTNGRVKKKIADGYEKPSAFSRMLTTIWLDAKEIKDDGDMPRAAVGIEAILPHFSS